MGKMVNVPLGPVGARRHVNNTRGLAFGGAALIVGKGRNQRAHVFTATSVAPLVPGSIEKIDPKTAAADLGPGVLMFVPNAGRNWTMDEIDVQVGETVEFQGVKMAWVGDMSGDEIMAHFGAPYVVGKILRDTNWIYKAGQQVCLLRDPEGLTWVMQEYTKEVDKSLTMENVGEIGPKLKNLPAGWKFETKVLTEDLSLDTRRSNLWASIMRDELGNTYEGTGFDDIASYIP
jgi:hypothetical protein